MIGRCFLATEKLMNLTSIDQENKIERYILKQMKEDEASEFEAYYLSNDQCITQLEIAEKLYEGIKSSVHLLDISSDIANSKITAANDSNWFKKSVPAWSVAALLVIMIFPMSVIYNTSSNFQDGSSPISLVNFELAGLRSNDVRTLTIQGGDVRNIIAIYIDTSLKQNVFDSYVFEIRDEKNNMLMSQINNLKVDVNDQLVFELELSHLANKNYQFILTGITEHKERSQLSSGNLAVRN